jgi:hypothetical protein
MGLGPSVVVVAAFVSFRTFWLVVRRAMPTKLPCAIAHFFSGSVAFVVVQLAIAVFVEASEQHLSKALALLCIEGAGTTAAFTWPSAGTTEARTVVVIFRVVAHLLTVAWAMLVVLGIAIFFIGALIAVTRPASGTARMRTTMIAVVATFAFEVSAAVGQARMIGMRTSRRMEALSVPGVAPVMVVMPTVTTTVHMV